MAGKSNTSATYFAQKKLLGKANTSILKTDGEELIGSNIQAASSQIFGQTLPDNPAQTLYLLQSASNGGPATVEYIHFALNVFMNLSVPLFTDLLLRHRRMWDLTCLVSMFGVLL